MPSRITVFEPHQGFAIAEPTASTTRSWLLDAVGQCQFTLASFTDPNCNRKTLQYGNLVLVEHIPTKDEFGNFRGQLPPWVGVILPPQQWDYGTLTITVQSAEALLLARPMPFTPVTGHAGQIYQKILEYGNDFGGVLIEPGEVFTGGATDKRDLRLTALEEASALASDFSNDFDVTPVVTSGPRTLDLFGNWYYQKGVVISGAFTEGAGGNMRLPKLTEQGTLYNVVNGYNSSGSTSKRITSTRKDRESIGDYAALGTNQTFNATTQSGIDQATASFLSAHSRPEITLELTALDVGNTFAGLAVGNVWNVSLKSVGFTGGNIGFDGAVRLLGVEYDDAMNEARLITQVLTADLDRDDYA
jgi:hypothetical protein